MSSGGQKTSGIIKTEGTKFAIETKSMSTWYDGKSMWTYNPRSNETTLVRPTQAELAETNPLHLISSRISQFTASYAKNQTAGVKTIVLTPKSKQTGFKSLHLTVDPKTMLPVKLVAVPTSGQAVTVSLSSVKTGLKHPASTFVYQKSRYPKATIVDLR